MRRSLFSLLIIAVIGIIVYSNTLKAPFVWDDNHLIVENSRIRDLSNFTDISGTRYLTFLSFAINYAINGYDVTGYHIFNIAIHILNAILVYFLILTIFKTPLFNQNVIARSNSDEAISKTEIPRSNRPRNDRMGNYQTIALLAGLLFVSHPVHTMAVTNINQRSVLLATFFYLLSVVMYMKWRLRIKQKRSRPVEQQGKKNYCSTALLFYCASLLSAVLAMKCKEISFTLPFVILLFDRCFFGRECGFKKSVVYAIPILLTLLIIPLDKPQPDVFAGSDPYSFRIEDRHVLSGLNAKMLSSIPRKDYTLTELRVILTYARLFFLPVNLNFDYAYPIYQSFLNPNVFLSFLFLLPISGFGIYLFYRSRVMINDARYMSLRLETEMHDARYTAHAIRLISFGILWFFITLLIESFVVVLFYVIFEYRLYLPSVGIILFLAGTIGYFGSHLRGKIGYTAAATAIAVMITFSAGAYSRNELFEDELTLWEDTIKKSPLRPGAHNNLGIAYYNRNMLAEAANEYKTALKLNPYLSPAYCNLGAVYVRQGRFAEAIIEYNAALRLSPNYAEIHSNLGDAYMNLGSIDDAIVHYRAALRLNKDLAATHYNLGIAYKQKGFINEAMKEFQMALTIKPDFLQAYQNMESLRR